MTLRWFYCLTLLALAALPVSISARSHHRSGFNEPGAFDYYVLALSYAPDFCDQPNGNKNSAECGIGRRTGFVVHGLWPQGENSRGPESCGPAIPVSQDIVRIMLNYIPTQSLIQHEWEMHGTCTGLPVSDYFAQVRGARDSIAIPNDLRAVNTVVQAGPQGIETKFARANPQFPPTSFRVTCYRNAELQETRVCFDKSLHSRACGASAGFCGVPVVSILPVR